MWSDRRGHVVKLRQHTHTHTHKALLRVAGAAWTRRFGARRACGERMVEGISSTRPVAVHAIFQARGGPRLRKFFRLFARQQLLLGEHENCSDQATLSVSTWAHHRKFMRTHLLLLGVAALTPLAARAVVSCSSQGLAFDLASSCLFLVLIPLRLYAQRVADQRLAESCARLVLLGAIVLDGVIDATRCPSPPCPG